MKTKLRNIFRQLLSSVFLLAVFGAGHFHRAICNPAAANESVPTLTLLHNPTHQ